MCRPYFLPCLVAAVVAVITLILSIIYVDETLPSLQKVPAKKTGEVAYCTVCCMPCLQCELHSLLAIVFASLKQQVRLTALASAELPWKGDVTGLTWAVHLTIMTPVQVLSSCRSGPKTRKSAPGCWLPSSADPLRAAISIGKQGPMPFLTAPAAKVCLCADVFRESCDKCGRPRQLQQRGCVSV